MKTLKSGKRKGSQKQYNKGFVKACFLYDRCGKKAHDMISALINNNLDNIDYQAGLNDASRFYNGLRQNGLRLKSFAPVAQMVRAVDS